MHYLHRSIVHRLADAKLALGNISGDADLLEAMRRVSYDAARLEAGRALWLRARERLDEARQKRAEVLTAVAKRNAARAAAHRVYGAHLALARVAFRRDPAVLVHLGAKGRRAQALEAWIAQAHRFYRTLLETPEASARMATFGTARAALEEGLALVDALAAAQRARTAAVLVAKQATALRREAMKALDDYMVDFFALARIALPGDQRLEKLGIHVPS